MGPGGGEDVSSRPGLCPARAQQSRAPCTAQGSCVSSHLPSVSLPLETLEGPNIQDSNQGPSSAQDKHTVSGKPPLLLGLCLTSYKMSHTPMCGHPISHCDPKQAKGKEMPRKLLGVTRYKQCCLYMDPRAQSDPWPAPVPGPLGQHLCAKAVISDSIGYFRSLIPDPWVSKD